MGSLLAVVVGKEEHHSFGDGLPPQFIIHWAQKGWDMPRMSSKNLGAKDPVVYPMFHPPGPSRDPLGEATGSTRGALSTVPRALEEAAEGAVKRHDQDGTSRWKDIWMCMNIGDLPVRQRPPGRMK